MEELLARGLGAIAEVLFEAVFEIAADGSASLLTRAISKFFRSVSEINPVATTVALGMPGVLIGFLSVVAYLHPLVHPSRLHGVSVIPSPLTNGFVVSPLSRVESYGLVFQM